LSKKNKDPLSWPVSIANWQSFDSGDDHLGSEEYPLFTDAWIIGQGICGPYNFINTIASSTYGQIRPAIVLRYARYLKFEISGTYWDSNEDCYHGKSSQEELAAVLSVAMGVRLRAGRTTRRFEQNSDPLGTPQELHSQPFFAKPDAYNIPSAATGQHSLNDAFEHINFLPRTSTKNAIAIIRSSRLYQDSPWLAESEPELAWILLVSAIETAAFVWSTTSETKIKRLELNNPNLYAFLLKRNDEDLLGEVAKHYPDETGAARKFCDFILNFSSDEPQTRPPIHHMQFLWQHEKLKKALKTIYGYRSRALHDGIPFPSPMCKPQAFRNGTSEWCYSEIMLSMTTSERGGVWKQEDIPMTLHLFEFITRRALLNWWASLRFEQTPQQKPAENLD